MKKKLNILFVVSEVSPLVSTGGLAEVAQALSSSLRDRGHDVRVALPCYRQLSEDARGTVVSECSADFGGRRVRGALRASSLPGSGVPLYLVEHDGYFGRQGVYGTAAHEYPDNAERFCFFALSLLDALPRGGWRPDVVHCHDWHAAPMAVFLRSRWLGDPFWSGVPVVFTIHNLAFQGRYPAERFAATGIPEELFNDRCMRYEGDMNLMKGAIRLADALTTVSPRYAREIQTLDYGAGLHNELASRSEGLTGILNGVDTSLWNPERDPHIAAPFSGKHPEGKAACKADLQRAMGLPVEDVPLFGLVTRLYWQKGVDLLLDALPSRLAEGAQCVLLGSGDPDLEGRVMEVSGRFPRNFAVRLGYDAALSHKIIAGGDFLLMPSRYEPCGLTQMYALAYGTVPVVRRTGGLYDTVVPLNTRTLGNGTATGVCFIPQTAGAVGRALDRAAALWADKDALARVRSAGMARDFSWERSAGEYASLYGRLAGRGGRAS
ncbi:MAG TPA: glycogen synthase GlgA [Candidatus Hydrogenedentes bacterium]|nr:glycogen synthase GlgA [Candidatus Hydrogenedentota bacterium]